MTRRELSGRHLCILPSGCGKIMRCSVSSLVTQDHAEGHTADRTPRRQPVEIQSRLSPFQEISFCTTETPFYTDIERTTTTSYSTPCDISPVPTSQSLLFARHHRSSLPSEQVLLSAVAMAMRLAERVKPLLLATLLTFMVGSYFVSDTFTRGAPVERQ